MPGTLAWSDAAAKTGLLALALAGVALTLLAILGYRAWKAARVTPQERERRRRDLLVKRGKMGDAALVDVRDGLLFFTYDVRGVEYTASQDISALKDMVPQDLSSIDAVAVRYLPENPANSIVLAEDWTGLCLGKTAHER
jgi:hypothetical protein